jgi:hypothetical protein
MLLLVIRSIIHGVTVIYRLKIPFKVEIIILLDDKLAPEIFVVLIISLILSIVLFGTVHDNDITIS